MKRLIQTLKNWQVFRDIPTRRRFFRRSAGIVFVLALILPYQNCTQRVSLNSPNSNPGANSSDSVGSTSPTATPTPAGSPTSSPTPSPSPTSEISKWSFVDGDGTAMGLQPSLGNYGSAGGSIVFNSKLYVSMKTGSNSQTETPGVKVYNGNDAAPAWTSVGGYFGNLFVFNNKLYISWAQSVSTGVQGYVAVYNGNDAAPVWTTVTTGLSGDVTGGASVYDFSFTSNNGKLYISWMEVSVSATFVATYASHIKVYNGNDAAPTWTSVDPSSKGIATAAGYASLMSFNNQIYITWSTYLDSNQLDGSRIHAAVYNGNDGAPVWTSVDGNATGINQNAEGVDSTSVMTTFNGKLYMTWNEGGPVQVAVYNSNDAAPKWTLVTGVGIARSATDNTASGSFGVNNGKLYVVWSEKDGVKGDGIQIRIAVYNGNDATPTWTSVDGNGTRGLNVTPTEDAFASGLTSFNNKLYNFWTEGDSGFQLTSIRMAVGQ